MRLLEVSIPLCDLRLMNAKEGSYNAQKFSDSAGATAADESSSSLHEMKLRRPKMVNYAEKKFIHNQGSSDSDYKDSKSESSDLDDEDTKSDSSDSDNEDTKSVKSQRKKGTYKKEEDNESPERSPKKLSSYEEMIAKNRAESMAFLQTLKIEEVKAGLQDAVNAVSEKNKKVQNMKRAYKRVAKTSPLVQRKSRRLANMDIDFSEDALFDKSIKEAKEVVKAEKERESKRMYEQFYSRAFKAARRKEKKGEKLKEISILPEMPFEHALHSSELYEGFVNDVNISQSGNDAECKESKFFIYERSILKNLNLDENNIAKVTPDRISALGWYPSAEHLIVAVGSKYGNLGIWNVKSPDSSPYLFKIHYEGITRLKFNPYNPVQMFTSSYDGVLRCGDLEKHVFEQVYGSQKSQCTYFDFLSENTFLVAQRNGQVAIVDNRVKGKCCEKTHKCHDYSIKTVDIHPVNKNIFVSAENKGTIRLWDLRRLQEQPVADITHHKRCVNSAYFSPVTGNAILATSLDDTISLFDSMDLTQDIKLKKSMKHNNFTGRWLSVFRATWLPNCDDAFVVGSMLGPRRIEVYDKNMNAYHIIRHPNLTTISSINAFHPYIPALAGANSSGKVFVFT